MGTFKQIFMQNKQQQLEKKVLTINRLQKIANKEGNAEKVAFYTKRLINLKNRIEKLK